MRVAIPDQTLCLIWIVNQYALQLSCQQDFLIVITLKLCHLAITKAKLVYFLRSFPKQRLLLWDRIQQVLAIDPLPHWNKAASQRITISIQLKILWPKKPNHRFMQIGGIEEEQLRSYPALPRYNPALHHQSGLIIAIHHQLGLKKAPP